MSFENPSGRPSRLNAIAALTLASGILNLLWSAVAFLSVIILGFGTFLVGCICLPLGVYPLVLGVLEIVYALRLLRDPVSPSLRPAYYIAVMEIIDTLFGNVAALIVGVLSLILYNDRAVRHYFGDT